MHEQLKQKIPEHFFKKGKTAKQHHLSCQVFVPAQARYRINNTRNVTFACTQEAKQLRNQVKQENRCIYM